MNIVNKDKINFLFYDYETFGIHTSLDKPSQFACIRTDFDLNVISKPNCLYCYPPADYLPDPNSILITGITPQYVCKNGQNEFFFAKNIFNILNTHNTCIIGYNNLTFDDEITRNIFYRNFLDSYSWSWKNNNSRWDLMRLVQACYVLSPTGIYWPKNKNGSVSFKLEALTKANNIVHDNTHDAISDVYATVLFTKFIKTKKKEIFNFIFKYRTKRYIKHLINIKDRMPLVYISNFIHYKRNKKTCIIPLSWKDDNCNILIFFDLYMDINKLINYLNEVNVEDITFKELYYLGINILYLNQCPVLIPVTFFTNSKLLQLDIHMDICLQKIKLFFSKTMFIDKIMIFFNKNHYNKNTNNVDLKLYDAFFSIADQNMVKKIHHTHYSNWNKLNLKFIDDRLEELFFRLRARNFYDILNQNEKKRWKLHCLKYFHEEYLYQYFTKLEQLIILHRHNINKLHLLNNLKDYVNDIILRR